MKMCLAVALMVVATLTTTSFASPVQPITEAAGEEILPDLESINNEASIAQYPHDLEPIKNEASITQQNCPVDLNIPAFIFTIQVRVCSVTPTTCGLVRVRVGTVVNVLVQVCQLANGGNGLYTVYIYTNFSCTCKSHRMRTSL